ncbi:MAG TPA: GNAT family N-acetyltransferase [Candidatus Sulfotelmatobacter sp.]|nr:GNAT family N-acetyltransferase [Candidatus Sulfotelmatobacter sp.]
MTIRPALINDIEALHTVRMAVKENVLNNPALVTRQDYEAFLTTDGRGWLCEAESRVAGFAILDMQRHNVWALFLHPDFEGRGIGKRLQEVMLQWYFAQTDHTLWLSTGPGTRAEEFYRRTGWKETGTTAGGETRFEMSREAWESLPARD